MGAQPAKPGQRAAAEGAPALRRRAAPDRHLPQARRPRRAGRGVEQVLKGKQFRAKNAKNAKSAKKNHRAFLARNYVLLAYVSKCAARPLVCGGRRAPIGRTRKGPPGEAQRCATQWAFLSAKLRTIRAAGLRGIRYRRLSECTAAGIP